MANVHKNLPSLYSDIANAIRIKQEKTSNYLYNEPNVTHNTWFNEQGNKYCNNYIYLDRQYAVTCDGKTYVCTAYSGHWGMWTLGNENYCFRGEENEEYYPGEENLHYEDVPFCIAWEENMLEGLDAPFWACWGIYLPDDEPHDVKVVECFEQFQYITPKNFPEEIKKIPSGIPIAPESTMELTIKFTDLGGSWGSAYGGLDLTGCFVDENNYLKQEYINAIEDAVIDQEYIQTFRVLKNTVLECFYTRWGPNGAWASVSGDAVADTIQTGMETTQVLLSSESKATLVVTGDAHS